MANRVESEQNPNEISDLLEQMTQTVDYYRGVYVSSFLVIALSIVMMNFSPELSTHFSVFILIAW